MKEPSAQTGLPQHPGSNPPGSLCSSDRMGGEGPGIPGTQQSWYFLTTKPAGWLVLCCLPTPERKGERYAAPIPVSRVPSLQLPAHWAGAGRPQELLPMPKVAASACPGVNQLLSPPGKGPALLLLMFYCLRPGL